MEKSEVVEWLTERVRGRRPTVRGWVNVQCLFCPAEKRRPTLGVNIRSGAYSCFRCGKTGHVDVSVVFSGMPEHVAAHVTPEPVQDSPDLVFPKPDGYVSLYDYADHPSEYLTDPIAFLKGRQIDVDAAAALGVGVCTSGRYAGRMILPSIRACGAPWFGFSARMMWRKVDPDVEKYLYPPGMERGKLFLNHDALFVDTHEPLLVVEGGLDALAHWPNAVAMYGGLSDLQFDALCTARRPVCFVFDGDAWRHAHATVLRLRMKPTSPPCGFVRLEAGFDPDDIPRRKLRTAALDSINANGIPAPIRP